MRKRNLIIVSNRIPVMVKKGSVDATLVPSSGGLVSALEGFLSSAKLREQHGIRKIIWIGSADSDERAWKQASKEIRSHLFSYQPVFVPKQIYENYYHGFCNSTLWPLFHYFPSYSEYKSRYYEAYEEVNRSFLQTVLLTASTGDIIWVHDYQLMLLPKLIREMQPVAQIGFFLHIPFPSYELYRLLPKEWRQNLLRGMLGADIVGFHTLDYSSHFQKSVHMILGANEEMGIIKYENRLIAADVFPVSIDYRKYFEAFNEEKVIALRDQLKDQCGKKKIIFSADRLDYTKGIKQRLLAFRHFLTKYPEYQEKVVFILLIVPSRDTISKYTESKQEINELVGHINGTFGSVEWQPVIYQYKSFDFSNLMACYTGCDVALITPLRDGMNLVAKEFVASRKDKKGILILSEMTGAASELQEALIINPTDKEDVAAKIKTALEMPEEEQNRRINAMQQRLGNYDVVCWGNEFLKRLQQVKEDQRALGVNILSPGKLRKLLRDYRKATRRLLLLDYDGTLVPLVRHPHLAAPGEMLFKIISQLSDDVKNSVFIISGRTRAFLEKCFNNLSVNLVAEHGALLRFANEAWNTPAVGHKEWKDTARQAMIACSRRCKGSFVEEKEFSLAWHFRNSEPELGELRALELFNELNHLFRSFPVQVIKGIKVVEIRNMGFDKGSVAMRIKELASFDFILAIGDDSTDEDMFRALQDSCAYTVKVGSSASLAKYNLADSEDTIMLLQSLTGR